jgi:hypothetical protein
MANLFHPEDYETFLHGLKERIRTAQVRAALAVNRELTLLYFAPAAAAGLGGESSYQTF